MYQYTWIAHIINTRVKNDMCVMDYENILPQVHINHSMMIFLE
jgi:hypothetical protein